MITTKQDARLDVRLTPEHKRIIEEAATRIGQTVSDFVISTSVQEAQRIVQNEQSEHVTRLSKRDYELLMAILEDESTEPNEALVEAARRYKEQFGQCNPGKFSN